MIAVGVFGVAVIGRELSARARNQLERDLSRRSLETRSLLRDRELYLVESANFASNIRGISDALGSSDDRETGRLMQSVLALKTELSLLAATGRDGRGLVEFTRDAPGADARRRTGTDWSRMLFVEQALRGTTGIRTSGFLVDGDRSMLAIVTPVCSKPAGCSAAGVTIVAIGVDELAAPSGGTQASDGSRTRRSDSGVSIYAADGRLLATAGLASGLSRAPTSPTDELTGRIDRNEEIATAYAPLEVQGRRIGTAAVSIPIAPAYDAVRGAGFRLALIVLAAMVGVVGLGTLLSRSILGQVKLLVATNRALGGGELSARAPVLANDELGELARGVNQMAEQLQASVETLELRVDQRTEEVRRLLRERTEFFAAMSHELRTPLAMILRQAEMLRDPAYGDDAKRQVAAGRLTDAGEHLLYLVNDILDVAEAEAGHIEVQLADVRLRGVVDELRPTIDGLASGNDLRVSIQMPRDLPSVRADPQRLREIILNLVGNAVKYTPPGGKIALSSVARNGSVAVSISDSGVGIPAEAGERIFEPFYRVKGTKAQRGQASSGLGLALAKRLVEAQGGQISYTSQPGAGTTFTFSLDSVSRSELARAGRGRKPRGAPASAD